MAMARTIQSLWEAQGKGKEFLSLSHMRLIHNIQFRCQTPHPINNTHIALPQLSKWNVTQTQTSRRSASSINNCVSDIRKSTIGANVIRLINNEIDYELERCPPQQVRSEINGFKVDERPGEQWIRLEKQFEDGEVIKIEVTMFDRSVLVGKVIKTMKSNKFMVVTIFKKASNQVLEFICSAWPKTVKISKLFVRPGVQDFYSGPKFRELDDELQQSLYEFLKVRGIDDSLCIYLHHYVNYKAKAEYIHWLKSVKSVMEN